jgi:Bacterial extracellular solute-binding proteins, family 5 Middle
VRRALALAVDRKALSDNLFFGLIDPAHGPLSTGTPSYWAGVEDVYKPDRRAAIALLEEAGWRTGPDGRILWRAAAARAGHGVITADNQPCLNSCDLSTQHRAPTPPSACSHQPRLRVFGMAIIRSPRRHSPVCRAGKGSTCRRPEFVRMPDKIDRSLTQDGMDVRSVQKNGDPDKPIGGSNLQLFLPPTADRGRPFNAEDYAAGTSHDGAKFAFRLRLGHVLSLPTFEPKAERPAVFTAGVFLDGGSRPQVKAILRSPKSWIKC